MQQVLNAKLTEIERNIKSIKIQGATNIAKAVLIGIKLLLDNFEGNRENLRPELKEVGERLSKARQNEPLARNAVKYVLYELDHSMDKENLTDIIVSASNACENYEALIANAKVGMITYGTEALAGEKVILTHCHSSTVIAILKNLHKLRSVSSKKPFKVVATETRPLFQGRKTAKELLSEGIDVTLIVDDAASGFIMDRSFMPVDSVIVGCDELLRDGSFINKVGTYQMALASREDKDKFYVATTLLKLNPVVKVTSPSIELRDAKEIWPEAPKGLSVYNPAFEHTSAKFVTGYITEAGVLKAKDLLKVARKVYPWMLN